MEPTIPPMPCTPNASRASSYLNFGFTTATMKKQTIGVINPIKNAPSKSTVPAAGVIATNPATAPVQAPTVVGFLLQIQSIAIQVTAATAVAICVTMNALAARPSAASPLPALKPNQPSHRKEVPRNTNVMLCGVIG